MTPNPTQQADAITTALQYLTDRIAVIESCVVLRDEEQKRLEMAARELRTALAVIEGAVSRQEAP